MTRINQASLDIKSALLWRIGGERPGPSYYRARYYDPSAGRFLSEDPITFEGGVNFYGYTQNMPCHFGMFY